MTARADWSAKAFADTTQRAGVVDGGFRFGGR